jgi:hypothetical protein
MGFDVHEFNSGKGKNSMDDQGGKIRAIGRKTWNWVTKKDWPGWARRECLFSQIGVALLLIFLQIIPATYLLTTEIPPMSQLKVSQGELSYRKLGKFGADRLLSLTEGMVKHDYSCKKTFVRQHKCYLKSGRKNPGGIDNLVGQQATVWWFERKIYPWVSQRHLVRLVVNGREEVSYEETLEDVASQKRFEHYASAVLRIVFLLFIWFIDRRTAFKVERSRVENKVY